MKDNFELCFTRLVSPAIEGGYGNDKYDKGGPTNFGVIQTEYNAYRARKGLVAQSVRFISLDEAREIYRYQYWNTCKCDDLPSGLDWIVFDAAVNSGPVQSAKWLQRGINQCVPKTNYPAIGVDGHIGLETEDRARDIYFNNSTLLINTICDLRLGMLRKLSNWWRFGKGWTNRVNLVHKQAVDMVHPIEPRPTQPQFLPPIPLTEDPWYIRLMTWLEDLFSSKKK